MPPATFRHAHHQHASIPHQSIRINTHLSGALIVAAGLACASPSSAAPVTFDFAGTLTQVSTDPNPGPNPGPNPAPATLVLCMTGLAGGIWTRARKLRIS